MLWDKYSEKLKAITVEPFDAAGFVENSIRNYVGTQDEINKERERLVIEAADRDLVVRNKYHAECNVILREYSDELFSEFDAPVAVLESAYSIACDRGHSAGYAEVESIFRGMVEVFIDTFNLGFSTGTAKPLEEQKDAVETVDALAPCAQCGADPSVHCTAGRHKGREPHNLDGAWLKCERCGNLITIAGRQAVKRARAAWNIRA